MKTIALKTENPLKYLSVHLLENSWSVELNSNQVNITNLQTNQTYCFIDLNQETAAVFEDVENAPIDWRNKDFYYYPETKTWEKVMEGISSETVL